MESFSVKTTSHSKRFLLQKTNYLFDHSKQKPSDQPRQLSQVGSDSYKRSLRRAFSRAKLLAFFNTDLSHFITFTYREEIISPNQVIQDIKYLVQQHRRKSAKPLKYIYVMEIQNKREKTTGKPVLHVHMIANDALQYEINKNGYRSVKDWLHGFSSVLTIKDFDNEFKPYLYLFKYMAKAQRVGRSFIHISRNFDKIESVDYADYINQLQTGDIVYKEDFDFIIDDQNYTINKSYIKAKDAIL